MKFLPAISLALIAACAGCSDKTDSGYPVVELTSTPVDFGEEVIIGSPISMVRNGNFIAINDNKIDSAFHIIDIATPKYLGQFGRKGSGPGEISRIALISSADDGFIFSEPLESRVTRLKVDPEDFAVSYEPLFKTEGSLWFIEQLSNGNYLTSEGYVDYPELFTIFSPEGKVITHTGDRQIPEKVSHLPASAVTGAYQYVPYPSPDHTKVLALSSGEAAGFYKVDADTVALIAQFFNPEAAPDFVFTDTDFRGQRGTRPTGFFSAAASNDLVYIISSEVSMEQADKIDENNVDYITGKVIYVYDWEGNRKGEIHTDRRLRHITAPDASGRMYALTEDGCDPTLVVLEIPQALR